MAPDCGRMSFTGVTFIRIDLAAAL